MMFYPKDQAENMIKVMELVKKDCQSEYSKSIICAIVAVEYIISEKSGVASNCGYWEMVKEELHKKMEESHNKMADNLAEQCNNEVLVK